MFSRGADFIGRPRPGLTPDGFSRGREVVEGVQGFLTQKGRRSKSKERPRSGDRSFSPCLDSVASYEGFNGVRSPCKRG